MQPSSVTETKGYLGACERAVQDVKFYNGFRSHQEFRTVMEHVNVENAWQYLAELQKVDVKGVFDVYDLARFKELNDTTGGPELTHFGGFGFLSATTMRYIYTVADLIQKFGKECLERAVIVEIGAGYGGLCRIVRSLFPQCQYHIVDLDAVTQLVHKFNKHDPKVHLHPYEEFDAKSKSTALIPKIDLVISNYAWSECRPPVRDLYFRRILKHATCGYMILNYLSSDEQKEVLNKMATENQNRTVLLVDETPRTHPNNNLLWWKPK